MESLSPVLSPTAVKFCYPKLASMAASAATLPSFSFTSMTSAQRRTPTSIHSAKPTKTLSATATTNPISVPPKKVLVPIGYGTEEMEAVIIVDVLRRAGADVTVASVEPQLQIEASCGTKLVADTSISSCSDQIFDLVALPGGMPGSVRLRDCSALQEITRKQAEESRLYGAICAAPAVALLPWGLLKRRQTTCHPAFMHKLPTFWAVKSNIQVSGGLTTSRGPGTSYGFALCLVEQLFGESIAKEIGESLLICPDDEKSKKEEFNDVEWSFDHIPRVLIPVANGSEDIEVVTIVDILRRAHVDVIVASVEKSVRILGSQGTKIIADKLIGVAAESTYDLIILPGGNAGAERLSKSRILKNLLKEQELAGRVYGAVCSSPEILHKQGLLKGKKATAHPSIVSKLTNEVINGTKVVIDGKLITSGGLSTVTDFALAIVSKLHGHARARRTRSSPLLKSSSPFSSSELKSLPTTVSLRSAEIKTKLSSNDWEPSVPFQPSFILPRAFLSSSGRQYDPLRDSIELPKFSNISGEASFYPEGATVGNKLHPQHGESASGTTRPACDGDTNSMSSHNAYHEKVLDNSCYTRDHNSPVTVAETAGTSAVCQNGTMAGEENPLGPPHPKCSTKQNKASSATGDSRHQSDGSRHQEGTKLGRFREKNEVDGEHLTDGDVQQESKAVKNFRAALVDLVKELLKPKWREGGLSKDTHNVIVKRAVEKIISAFQPHQIPSTIETVVQYLSACRPKISKLVEGYVEKYGKS